MHGVGDTLKIEKPTYLKLKMLGTTKKTDRTMRLVSEARRRLLVSIVGGRPVLSHVRDQLGKGQLWGRETTARQTPTMPCRGGCAPSSLLPWRPPQRHAAHDVWPHELRGRDGEGLLDPGRFLTKASDPRLLREWKRSLAPDIPRGLFRPEGGASTVYKPENVPRDMLTLSGRYKGESHRAYCRRMLRLCEWGGESELFVASAGRGSDRRVGGGAPCR